MHYTNQSRSSYTGERKLDQERAASMADEGGVSGAIIDARDQARGPAQRRFGLPSHWGARELWALGALGAGACLLFLGLREVRR